MFIKNLILIAKQTIKDKTKFWSFNSIVFDANNNKFDVNKMIGHKESLT